MIRLILCLCLYIISITIKAQVKELEVFINNNDIALEGTLTYNPNKKQPLIIWVAGSGNIDRNGNQYPMIKANYIKQFRNEITKNNIAFFSYDKRTANRKNLNKLKGILFKDFMSDVEQFTYHFKNDYNFSEIILLGHSQGSLTAMLALKNVDKFISVAGAGMSIDKIITEQINKQNPMLTSIVKTHFNELSKNDTIQKVNPFLVSIFAPQNQKFIKSWMSYKPEQEIKKVTIPILIINGNKDLQVSVDNAKKLYSNNLNSQLSIIENMNHVLKNIKSDEDNQKSYFSPEFAISKELIQVVTDFVLTKK